MAETVNYQCPACGGVLHYAGETETLLCDYCDSQFTVEQVEALYAAKQEKADEKVGDSSTHSPSADSVVAAGAAQAAEAAENNLDPIQAYLDRANWDDADSNLLASSTCSSCGAQLMHDKTTAVTQCPYCGNNTVIPGTLAGTLKPDYVIPFKVTKEKAIAALQEHYKNKKFLPTLFAEENHMQEIQGVYVPFWLYSAQAHAQGSFKAKNIRSWTDGEYQITETDIYHAERTGHMNFVNVPVDGSQKMPDAHMDSIEPFDYSKLKPFSVSYLPGYLADRFDIDATTCQTRALGRMETTAAAELQSTVTGYAEVTPEGTSVNATMNEVSYALLPVWMLHTKWHDQDFLFAMNGQTGKFIGDLPIDKKKVVSWFLRIFIPSAAVISAIAFLLF